MKIKLVLLFFIFLLNTYLFSFSLSNEGLKINGYTRNIRGEMGETIGRNYLEMLEKGSFKSITPRAKPQGLDLISLRFDGPRIDVIVAECKFSDNPTNISSLLKMTTNSGRQMSMNWVRDRILNDILPNYNLDIDNITFKKPVGNVDRFNISEDTFLFRENGKQYYYSTDGKFKSKEFIVENTNLTRKALEGAAEGYNLRRRLLVCYGEKGEIKQAVYDITDLSDGLDSANKKGLAVIIQDGNNSQMRLIKLGEDMTVDESVLKAFSDEVWIEFIKNRGLDADKDLVQSLSIKERAALLQFKNGAIDDQLFYKLYRGTNVRKINKQFGVSSNSKIDLSKLTPEQKSDLLNNLLSEKARHGYLSSYRLKRLGKSSAIMFGVGFLIQSGVDVFSFLLDDKDIDWKGVAQDGIRGGILMGASVIPLSLATELSENIMAKGAKQGISFFAALSENAIGSIANSSLKVAGKRAASGALKSVIPSAVGAVIGLSIDAIGSRGLSPELRAAVMKRSVMIESVAFAISIGLDAAVSVITGGSGTLVIGLVSGLFETGISMGLELLVPMPDDLSPDIIRKKYANNPKIVIEWAQNALGYSF